MFKKREPCSLVLESAVGVQVDRAQLWYEGCAKGGDVAYASTI